MIRGETLRTGNSTSPYQEHKLPHHGDVMYIWACVCVCQCANHQQQHPHLWTFSPTVHKTAHRTWEEEEVLSRHTVVLFQWRNVMTGEICRAELAFEGLFLMSGKWSLGAEFAWKALETNHGAQWALGGDRIPALSVVDAVLEFTKISHSQHMHGEENDDMTSSGGVNSSLRSGNTIVISTFHSGWLTMC